VLSAGLLILGALAATPAPGQAPDQVQQVEQRLAEKRAAAEAHRKQMEGVKDPKQLSVEMRKHFQMTEEVIALMLERRKLMEAHAPKAAPPAASQSAPSRPGMGERGGMPGGGMEQEKGGMKGGATPGPGMQGGGMPGGSMPGGMMRPGMEGAPGGMMGKEMGGMQSTPGSGAPMPGGTMRKDMGSMSSQAPAAPSAPAAKSPDMEQMMQRLIEHSKYMETIQDRPVLDQEILRHQKMVDQMLELMLQ
jgi:hypothetical protein